MALTKRQGTQSQFQKAFKQGKMAGEKVPDNVHSSKTTVWGDSLEESGEHENGAGRGVPSLRILST